MIDKNTYSFLRLFLPALAIVLALVAATTANPNGDDFVGWAELSAFAEGWLNNRDSGDGFHISANPSHSRVDFFDFALLAQHWRAGEVYAIAYDPYKDVDWAWWHRALAQHHDHMGRLSLDRIRAYDQAGYNIIAALDYAGKKSGGRAYCNYRLWPVYKYLAGFNGDRAVLATLSNIRLFISAMEEIGCYHITSPFLTTYIELWEPAYSPTKQQWHYQNTQQCIDLINWYGGIAIIAHPTASMDSYMKLENYKGIEIVNANYYRLWLLGLSSLNYNEHFQAVWDTLLTNKSTRIWGFAVNDWWGPWNNINEAYIDSGKIIALLPSFSLADYRNSLEKGSFFAIHDWGAPRQNKGRYPIVAAITASNHSITIYTDGQVSWIANGQRIAQGNSINLTEYPSETGYKYVRAEISNSYGTVFTQPWTLQRAGFENRE